jgi:hypothetical protein
MCQSGSLGEAAQTPRLRSLQGAFLTSGSWTRFAILSSKVKCRKTPIPSTTEDGGRQCHIYSVNQVLVVTLGRGQYIGGKMQARPLIYQPTRFVARES